jgi:hypothetical protein
MSDWLQPYDGSTWNDFPGEPTIYPEPTGIRQHKFMFDALRAATLNVTNNPDEADYVLDNSHHATFQDKKLFGQINRELNIPMPREYDYDPTTIGSIDHPVVLKPVLGKGAIDMNGSQSVYRAFQNGNALEAVFGNENLPFANEVKKKLYIVQESLADQSGATNKIHGFVLINGEGEMRVPYVYEEVWRQQPTYYCDSAIISPTTRTTHEAKCLEYAEKFRVQYDLKNTCLYIQCIIKDGVYYFIDADKRIPFTYCAKVLNEYFAEHLRFIFDAASDISYPTGFVARKDLSNLRLSPQYHDQFLAGRCDEFESVYWIARQASAPDSQDGRYMLLASGATEQEATMNLNNFVFYLTEDTSKTNLE